MKSTLTASITLMLALLAAAQQGPWAQCGGNDHQGGTTCVSGYHCLYQNDWYSQCVPGNPSDTNPPPSTSTTVTTTTSATTTTTTTGGSGGDGATDCPALPNGLGTSSSVLPDPFTFQAGGKVTSKTDWACRQAEISAQMQKLELGTLTPKPSSVTALYSGNKLTITASEGGKSISFSVTISKPGGSDVPAILYFGTYGASIPIPSSVGGIAFDNDEIAQQTDGSSRGRGKFYDLYGSNHAAGAMVAWAWAVSRVIDGLELTRSQTGIDPTRIGVTGCSRNGKGAMVAGALDPRVALTLPQESGAGGAGCWRLEDWQNRNGYSVQNAKQIVGENVWFGRAFEQHVNNVNALPFDHHMLAGLITPRAVYFMENPDMEWLGSISTYGCMGAARKQWQALGALDAFGYSQVGGHSHCSFPSSQQSELTAFIDKYLLGKGSASTGVFRTDQNYNFNVDDWSPWSVPTLS